MTAYGRLPGQIKISSRDSIRTRDGAARKEVPKQLTAKIASAMRKSLKQIEEKVSHKLGLRSGKKDINECIPSAKYQSEAAD